MRPVLRNATGEFKRGGRSSTALQANSKTGLADGFGHSYIRNENRYRKDRAMTAAQPIAPQARIGHVHLKVANIQRSLDFYCDVLGFELQQMYGRQAAFVSAGGYHHHIGLNTWESEGGQPPPPGTTGLFHVAILYPTRADLADALKRLIAHKLPLDGASDHGVSEALYLHDPDFNGIELYWDKPQDQWPRTPDGSLAMVTQRLDLNDLINTQHERKTS
jgi:catechol 2,3-dioxygenase